MERPTTDGTHGQFPGATDAGQNTLDSSYVLLYTAVDGRLWVEVCPYARRCLMQINEQGRVVYRVPRFGDVDIGWASITGGMAMIALPIRKTI